jgi:hypothetical protein
LVQNWDKTCHGAIIAGMVKPLEFVMIELQQATVSSVTPDTPETKTAFEAAQNGTPVDAINKLGESGWKLLEGTVISGPTSLAGAFATIFMYRGV